MPPERQLVTQLLQQGASGNKAALDKLMPLVYEQPRKLASKCLRAERPDHASRATALDEPYVRLVDADVAWEDRVHLRRILIDHATAHKHDKRGGGAEKVSLDETVLVGPQEQAAFSSWTRRCTGWRNTTNARVLWSSCFSLAG